MGKLSHVDHELAYNSIIASTHSYIPTYPRPGGPIRGDAAPDSKKILLVTMRARGRNAAPRHGHVCHACTRLGLVL